MSRNEIDCEERLLQIMGFKIFLESEDTEGNSETLNERRHTGDFPRNLHCDEKDTIATLNPDEEIFRFKLSLRCLLNDSDKDDLHNPSRYIEICDSVYLNDKVIHSEDESDSPDGRSIHSFAFNEYASSSQTHSSVKRINSTEEPMSVNLSQQQEAFFQKMKLDEGYDSESKNISPNLRSEETSRIFSSVVMNCNCPSYQSPPTTELKSKSNSNRSETVKIYSKNEFEATVNAMKQNSNFETITEFDCNSIHAIRDKSTQTISRKAENLPVVFKNMNEISEKGFNDSVCIGSATDEFPQLHKTRKATEAYSTCTSLVLSSSKVMTSKTLYTGYCLAENTLTSTELKSVQLPCRAIINPIYLKHIEAKCMINSSSSAYPRKKYCQSEKTNLQGIYKDKKNKVDYFVSDKIRNLELVSSNASVIFCRKSQMIPENDRPFSICLCDDCYTKIQSNMDQLLRENPSRQSNYVKDKNVILTDRVISTANEQHHEVISDDDTNDSFSSEKENLDIFCQAMNSLLQNSEDIDEIALEEYVKALQDKWLSVAINKYSKQRDVMNCITLFGTFPDNIGKMLLFSTDLEDNNFLHFAFGNSRFDIVEVFLDNKYATELLSKKNKLGHSPTMICSISDPETEEDWIVVEKALRLGNLNEGSTLNGQTPLMNAVARGSATMTKLLLDVGADPNFQDRDGSTALMYACEHGHQTCVKILMEHPKCNPFIKDCDNQTGCSIALQAGHKDIALFIYLQTTHKNKDGRICSYSRFI